MFTVVVKPFLYGEESLEPGDLIDSSGFRNEKALIGARFLRPAEPHEYAEAVGLVESVDPAAAENTDDIDTDATPPPAPETPAVPRKQKAKTRRATPAKRRGH
ncbi:MAG: hypothetical protein E6R03_14925 [Hyphomicrobiaceae bacterium]|nr:MAG: hypothetical protein E6R03_14925 [Hyphomicrobiaceae bacterium]